MAAPIQLLADALVTLVNTYSVTPALAASRKYLAEIELTTLAGRVCYVVPREDKTVGKADRHRWHHQLIIDVALVGKLADSAPATADTLLGLADALAEHLKANRVLPGRSEKLHLVTVQALWEPTKLKDLQVFSSAVQCNFVDIR